MADFNNPGQVSIAGGQIPVAEVMGISNPAFIINGQALDFATAIGPFTFKKLTQNSYDGVWNKGLKITAMGNTGTVQYTFMPAVLPVSNFSQSDLGNRSFGTKMNVGGKNIMFLQTNFGTNEFVSLTDDDYISSIQKQLIGTYSKSISIIKQELSILENTLFCLATGQFLFTDELGKRIQTDPNDPNNLGMGDINGLGTLQQPRLHAENVPLGNNPQAYLKQELNALSNGLMTGPLTLNTFNIGYSLDRMSMVCSFYMRTNLAYVLNLGWPTEANEKMIKKSSYDGAEISRGFNLMLTDNDTVPYFQNDIGMVTQEQMPSTVTGEKYEALPLGYGINNICPFNYTDYIVAMTTFDGAIEQYYTTDVPFNPYNIPNSKTGYRLGYMGGGGQVHVPNFGGTSGMFLDPSAYTKVLTSQTQSVTQTADSDGTVNNNNYNIDAGTSPSNSIPTDVYYNPSTTTLSKKQQAGYYQVYVTDITYYNTSTTNDYSIYGLCPNVSSGTGVTGSDVMSEEIMSYGIPANSVEAGSMVVIGQNAFSTDSTMNSDDVVFTGNIYSYYKILNNVMYCALVQVDFEQLLTDMTQAQAILLTGEDGMGYDRYCFPNLPTSTTANLSYTFNGPDTSTNQTIGNSLGLTFGQGATLRSLRALSMTCQITNPFNNVQTSSNGLTFPLQQLPTGSRKQILNLTAPGYNQLYMAPYNYIFTMPNDAPYITPTAYSQTGSMN